ncbi:MAG: serine O-acetyltransferase EpsC [Verrucomicrobiota bacterium]
MNGLPITELTDALLVSYRQHGGINHVDGANLPSRGAVVDITLALLRLLFPGFFDDAVVHASELKADTVLRMDSVAGRLEDEVCKSLGCFDAGRSTAEDRSRARALVGEFLRRLPSIRALLQTDVEAAFQGDPAARSREEIITSYPFIEAIAVQRLAHELHRQGVPLLPRMMTEWAHGRTGIDIHPGARIGSHFFIDHGTGTVIGETCVLGNHVKVFHGVTLGATSTSGGQALRGRKRHPTIEDHVTIYSGAVILGGETVIGRNSTVGGNVFLLHSVPPDSTVVIEENRVRVLPKRGRASDLDYQI